MERYIKQEGIILKNYRIGEFHKGVKVLTAENGLADFMAYGGYKGKSKIGPLVSPLTSGTFTLYQKPGIKTVKIQEFNPDQTFLNIKTDLKKYYAALLWVETILKSHGGGESSSGVYALMKEALCILEFSDEKIIPALLNQFFLRFLSDLGYPLETEFCHLCNEKIDKSAYLYFQKYHYVIVCKKCGMSGDLSVSPGIVRYIEYTMELDFCSAVKISLDKNDTAVLRNILLMKIQSVLECTLNTIAGAYEI